MREFEKEIKRYLDLKMFSLICMVVTLISIVINCLYGAVIIGLTIFHFNIKHIYEVIGIKLVWCMAISFTLSLSGVIYAEWKQKNINKNISKETLQTYLKLMANFNGSEIKKYDLIDLFYKYIIKGHNKDINDFKLRSMINVLYFIFEDDSDKSRFLPNKFVYGQKFRNICKEVFDTLKNDDVHALGKSLQISHFYKDNKESDDNKRVIKHKKNYCALILFLIGIYETIKEIEEKVNILHNNNSTNTANIHTIWSIVCILVSIAIYSIKMVLEIKQFMKKQDVDILIYDIDE